MSIWPHIRVGVTRFVELYFVNFRNFRDSAKYGVARAELSELSYFYEWNQTKNFPGVSPHEEYDVKTSASGVHGQH